MITPSLQEGIHIIFAPRYPKRKSGTGNNIGLKNSYLGPFVGMFLTILNRKSQYTLQFTIANHFTFINAKSKL